MSGKFKQIGYIGNVDIVGTPELVAKGTGIPEDVYGGGYVEVAFKSQTDPAFSARLAENEPELIGDVLSQKLVSQPEIDLLVKYKGKSVDEDAVKQSGDKDALIRARESAEKYFDHVLNAGTRSKRIVRYGDEWHFLNDDGSLQRPEYYRFGDDAALAAQPLSVQTSVMEQQMLFEQLEERASERANYGEPGYRALGSPFEGIDVPHQRLAHDMTFPEHSIINGQAPTFVKQFKIDGKDVYIVSKAVAPNPQYSPGGDAPKYLYDVSAVVREEIRTNSINASGRRQGREMVDAFSEHNIPSNSVEGSHSLYYKTEVIQIAKASDGIHRHSVADSFGSTHGQYSSTEEGKGWSFKKSGARDSRGDAILESTQEMARLDAMRSSGDTFTHQLADAASLTIEKYESSSSVALESQGIHAFPALYEAAMLPLPEMSNKKARHLSFTAADCLGNANAFNERLQDALGSTRKGFWIFSRDVAGIEAGELVKEVRADGTIAPMANTPSEPMIKGLTEESVTKLKRENSAVKQANERRWQHSMQNINDGIGSTVNFALNVGLMVGSVVGLQQAFMEFSQGHWWAAAGMLAASLAVGAVGFSGTMNKVNEVLNSESVSQTFGNLAQRSDQAINQGSRGISESANMFSNAIQNSGPSM